MNRAPRIVCVDGNIGAGKSTLLHELEARGYAVHREGLDKWGKWLPRFYTDPRRWCFTLQTAILLDMGQQHDRILRDYADEEIIFVERSPMSALIFVENSARSGDLDADETELYMDLHARIGWNPDMTFILSLDPETCLARIRTRGRAGEASITLEYLKALESGYVRAPGVRLGAQKSTGQIADEILRSVSAMPTTSDIKTARRCDLTVCDIDNILPPPPTVSPDEAQIARDLEEADLESLENLMRR